MCQEDRGVTAAVTSGVVPWILANLPHFSGPVAYLLNYAGGSSAARDSRMRVRQEIPSCGFGDLYESAGQQVHAELGGRVSAGGEQPFAVAWGAKIAHTVSIETIEYCGGQNSFERRRGHLPVAS